MPKQMTASQMGRKGGKATGASKVRGDSAYYRALAAKRTKALREFRALVAQKLAEARRSKD